MLKDVLKLNALGQVGGGSGGGGDCDWNIMKNKPFYTEKGEMVLPATTVELDPDSGDGVIVDAVPIETGKTYAVNWNGTEYNCTAEGFVAGGAVAPTIGNLGVMTGGAESGEPFIIAALPAEFAANAGYCVTVIGLDGSPSATVSIHEVVVHPLPVMYLPKMVVTFTKNENGEIVADKTLEQIQESVSAGCEVTGTYSEDLGESQDLTIYLKLGAYAKNDNQNVFGYYFNGKHSKMDIVIFYANEGIAQM